MTNLFNRNDGTFAQVDYASVTGTPTTPSTQPTLAFVTAATTADIAITVASTSTFTSGATVTQGSSGIWFVSATATFFNATTTSICGAKLWDGTTVLSESFSRISVSNSGATIALSGVITSPSSNLKIAVSSNSTATVLSFSPLGNSAGCVITAVRIG